MTRERAKELAPVIQAWVEGKTIQLRWPGKEWEDLLWNSGANFETCEDWRIKPATRPMTRGEVLYLVTTTPAMVVRFPNDSDPKPYPAQDCDWRDRQIEKGEWAIIDKHGDPVDGWHKFVTEA